MAVSWDRSAQYGDQVPGGTVVAQQGSNTRFNVKAYVFRWRVRATKSGRERESALLRPAPQPNYLSRVLHEAR